MKYFKGTQTEKLEDGVLGKLLLTDQGINPEGIWVKRFSGYSVLQNHCIALYPFNSWGMILPTDGKSYDLPLAIDIILHPDAWQEYLENNLIDENGNKL